ATVADVLSRLPGKPHYSTVRAQLRVLEEKGHVRHEEDGLRYVYAPTLSLHLVRRSALRHLVETFFDGSAEKVVAALLGGEASRLWTPTVALPGNAASQPLPTTIVNAVAASPTLNKLADVFLLIWFAGFLFVLFRLILGLFLLARISSRAVPLTTQSWIEHVSE